ncbi:hypothetical protein E1H18_2798 [Caulobacter sp. RHG1]|nr:hypothetical protein [Caulobacter sp. RHG1]
MRGSAITFFPLRGRSAAGAEGASVQNTHLTCPHLTSHCEVVRPRRGQKS